MPRLSLLGLLFLSATSSASPVFSDCGVYEVEGVVERSGAEIVLRVFAGTRSETRLKLVGDHAVFALRFAGGSSVVKGIIEKPVRGYRGEMEVISAGSAISDAAHDPRGKVRIVEKQKCR